MGWFKRLCLFVYGLAGILALAALALPWVGPYTKEATDLLYVPEYFRVLEALVGITGVGCLVCLLRSIFTPRNYKNVIISSDGGDQITVTRSAIASQAEHIVEHDGTCVAGSVRVRAKKRGSIRVYVRVTPKRPLDVVEKGEELHAALDEGLAKIAADKIKSVNLEFTDPQQMDDDVLAIPPVSADTSLGSVSALEEPTSTAGDGGVDVANDITVSMSSFHRGEGSQDDAPLDSDAGSYEPAGTTAELEPLGTSDAPDTESDDELVASGDAVAPSTSDGTAAEEGE